MKITREMEFYESEVPQYEAVQEYLPEIESAYYMGAGFDTTPGKIMETEIFHVDHHAPAVEFLQDKNLDARVADVTSYNPKEDFELIILSHLPTIEEPLIEENLTENGHLICRTDSQARKIDSDTGLDLQAVYIEDSGLVEKEFFNEEIEAELYLFQQD